VLKNSAYQRDWTGCASIGRAAGSVQPPSVRPRAAARHHAVALRVTSRRRLKAALASRRSQSTLVKPRRFTFRIQAMVLSQPNAGLIRGRAWRLFR
jgi:hypothetical protein